jgi:hypothetical protein
MTYDPGKPIEGRVYHGWVFVVDDIMPTRPADPETLRRMKEWRDECNRRTAEKLLAEWMRDANR